MNVKEISFSVTLCSIPTNSTASLDRTQFYIWNLELYLPK